MKKKLSFLSIVLSILGGVLVIVFFIPLLFATGGSFIIFLIIKGFLFLFKEKEIPVLFRRKRVLLQDNVFFINGKHYVAESSFEKRELLMGTKKGNFLFSEN